MRQFWSILFLLVICGCDRSPPPAPLPAATQATQAELPPAKWPPLRCDLSVVTPLRPRRPTHIAVDPSSNIYFVQENSDGGDTVFVIGNSASGARATRLSTGSILAALAAKKGSGNIQSIAAGADGNVYFFFAGGTDRQTLSCFGRFEPRAGEVRILAHADAIAAASGLGPSFSLARGTVVATDQSLWLWLRHSDDSALLNLGRMDPNPNGDIFLPTPTWVRPSSGTIEMTRDELRLSAGLDNSVLLLDTWTAALWKINPGGAADVVQTLVGLPQSLSAAGVNPDGDILLFAAISDPIQPRVAQRVKGVDIDTHYPALLFLHGGTIVPISRDDIHGPRADFPLYAMQLEQTFYELGRASWVGYDAASGELLRLRISPKTSP